MTTLFPQTTCLVSEALDRIGRHRFGCKWTGKEIDARRLPDPGKVTALKRKAAEDPTVLEDPSGLLGRWVSKEEFLNWPDQDSEGYRAERAAYLRYRKACRALIDALRYGYTRSWIITPEGERIDILAHWWESPIQLIVGALLNPSARSQRGFFVDEAKIRGGSGLSLRELIRPTLAPQDPGVRSKDSRDRALRVKDPRIAGAKGVLYIDQVALDKGLQEKEEGAAAPRPRGPRSLPRDAATRALDDLYPEKIPDKIWKTLTAEVNDWLAKNNESLEVSEDTVRRAANRK